MSIHHTRALLRAALDGSLARARFRKDRHFGLSIPEAVPGVPPRSSTPASPGPTPPPTTAPPPNWSPASKKISAHSNTA